MAAQRFMKLKASLFNQLQMQCHMVLYCPQLVKCCVHCKHCCALLRHMDAERDFPEDEKWCVVAS